MYDILVYLFENCQQAELATTGPRREEAVRGRLRGSDISEALHWLAGMLRAPQAAFANAARFARARFRAFTPRELAKLDAEWRGFLITLEQSGILTPRRASWSSTARCRVRRRARARAAQADRADGAVEPADADQPLVAEDLFSAPQARLPS